MKSPADDPRTDDALIAALNGGDASAFDAIYHRYRDWVVRTAYRITGNVDDALDVLQETFSYVFGKFPGFILTAKVTTFLYPVVKNLALKARQRRGHHSTDIFLPERAVNDPAPGDPREELTALLTGLSEGQREVLLLRFVDDFSLEEIAHALSIPLGTVKSRLHLALAALKTDPALKKYFQQLE